MNERDTPPQLNELDAKLRAARAARDAKENEGATRSNQGGVGFALRIGVELVAALIVGVGIGLFLDRWLDTAPWFLIGFFFIGAGAGIVNVYRATSRYGLAVGYHDPADETVEPREAETSADGSAKNAEIGERTAKE